MKVYRTGSQYCIIMCIYHAMPLLDYAISGQDPQLLCTSVEDLPIPEFDNIGMEAVHAATLFNSDLFDGTVANDFLGYNPRYWPWKSKIDRVHGAFTTTLKDWVAPIDDSYLFKWFNSKNGKAATISWPFFKRSLVELFTCKLLHFPVSTSNLVFTVVIHFFEVISVSNVS